MPLRVHGPPTVGIGWPARFAIGASLLACGPVVDPSGSAASTGDASTSSMKTSGTSTSLGTASSSSTAAPSTTADASEGPSSGDRGTTGECNCEGTPIDLNDEVDEGFTPAELLAMTSFLDARWIWGAIEAAPDTRAVAAGQYVSGAVFDAPGGGCDLWPCAAGVTINGTRVSIATADGRLDDHFDGILAGFENGGLMFEFVSDPVPLAAVAGTLADETFDNQGTPYIATTVSLDLVWLYDNDALTLQFAALYGDDGVQRIQLGAYEPR